MMTFAEKACARIDINILLNVGIFHQINTQISSFPRDGIHLSEEGSKIVVAEILKVLKQAEWKPSLHWKSMPTEFSEDSLYDLVAASGERTLNPSDWTFHREIQWD